MFAKINVTKYNNDFQWNITICVRIEGKDRTLLVCTGDLSQENINKYLKQHIKNVVKT